MRELKWDGKQIAVAREVAGFKQEDLAQKLQVSKQQISNWENSKRPPRIDNLFAIARALGIDPIELIIGQKPEYGNLTNEEAAILTAYNRATPKRQEAIKEILEVKQPWIPKK